MDAEYRGRSFILRRLSIHFFYSFKYMNAMLSQRHFSTPTFTVLLSEAISGQTGTCGPLYRRRFDVVPFHVILFHTQIHVGETSALHDERQTHTDFVFVFLLCSFVCPSNSIDSLRLPEINACTADVLYDFPTLFFTIHKCRFQSTWPFHSIFHFLSMIATLVRLAFFSSSFFVAVVSDQIECHPMGVHAVYF